MGDNQSKFLVFSHRETLQSHNPYSHYLYSFKNCLYKFSSSIAANFREMGEHHMPFYPTLRKLSKISPVWVGLTLFVPIWPSNPHAKMVLSYLPISQRITISITWKFVSCNFSIDKLDLNFLVEMLYHSTYISVLHV